MANVGKKVSPQACGVFMSRGRRMNVLLVEPATLVGRIVDERKPPSRTTRERLPSQECSEKAAIFIVIVVVLLVLAAGLSIGLNSLLDML